jgi:hypothetical protein
MERESDDFILRTARRIEELPDDYDTEDEGSSWGPGGLVPNPWSEGVHYGEEANSWSNLLRRAKRRSDRLFGSSEHHKVVDTAKMFKGDADSALADVEPEPEPMEVSAIGDADEDLDDIDKELLGEASYEDGASEAGESGEDGEDSEDDVMEED